MTKIELIKEEDFLKAILELKNMDEAKKFLFDILSATEIREISNRWFAARLMEAKINYIQIEELTGMSTATLSRISKTIHFTGKGGYQLMFKKFNKKAPLRESLVSIVKEIENELNDAEATRVDQGE